MREEKAGGGGISYYDLKIKVTEKYYTGKTRTYFDSSSIIFSNNFS